MPRLAPAVSALLAVVAFSFAGCDSDGSSSSVTTTCDFNFSNPDLNKKDFGEACTSGSECAYGVCILPGVDGNLVNDQFGFCSRGCDCENSTASQLSDEEKQNFTCLYPPGFQGRKRHVVPLCGAVTDCTAIDSGWTECRAPTSGGVKPICHALQ